MTDVDEAGAVIRVPLRAGTTAGPHQMLAMQDALNGIAGIALVAGRFAVVPSAGNTERLIERGAHHGGEG